MIVPRFNMYWVQLLLRTKAKINLGDVNIRIIIPKVNKGTLNLEDIRGEEEMRYSAEITPKRL